MYTIFVEHHEKNDATSYYVEIIKSAIKRHTNDVKETSNINDVGRNDIVIVITVKTFFLVWSRNRKQKLFIWFQGVLPEENLMMFNGLKKYFKYAYNRILEKLALHYSTKIFFVSESMHMHYKKVYGYKGNKHFIMPCFNQELEEQYFNNQKYLQPTFVYAGNLAKWQCIDKTLKLFSLIKQSIPDAKITFLTKEKDKAIKLAEQYDIYDLEVKYVPYTELNREMSKYKYGFLLRENTVVNNVATPTKMNSYLACGVIPIFSEVIGDFREVLKDIKYKIPVLTFEDCIKNLKEIENNRIESFEILKEYKKIFATYYSSEFYIYKIADFINLQ